MRTIKALFTTALVGALTVVMTASAFAATASYDETTEKVTVADFTLKADDQYTVLIVRDSVWTDISTSGTYNTEDILYLNQFDDSEPVLTNGMGTVKALTMDKNEKGEDIETLYKVLIGGENMESIEVVDLKLTPKAPETPETVTIQLGECDGIDGVDTRDALAILSHYAGAKSLTGNYLIAAECDGIDGIDTRDALAVLSHYAGAKTLGTVTVPVTE